MIDISSMEDKARNLLDKGKAGTDSTEELYNIIEEKFRYLEDYSDTLDTFISEIKRGLNSPSNLISGEAERDVAEKLLNLIKALLNHLDMMTYNIKSRAVMASLEKSLSPGLIRRLDDIADELDNLIENFELGLKFQKQFSELEPKFREYGKRAREVNPKKKLG